MTEEGDKARSGAEQAVHQLEEDGLTRAALADDDGGFSGGDVEREVSDDVFGTKRLLDMGEGEDGLLGINRPTGRVWGEERGSQLGI